MGFFECYGRQVEQRLLEGQSHRDIIVDIADVIAMMKENTNDVNDTFSVPQPSTSPQTNHPNRDGIMPRGTANFRRQVSSATRGSLWPDEIEGSGPTQQGQDDDVEGNLGGWYRCREEAGEKETARNQNLRHWVGRGRKVDVHLAKVVLDGNEQQIQGWKDPGISDVGEPV